MKRNSDGTVSVILNYNVDIQNKDITVQLDPSKSGNPSLAKFSSASRSFFMVPSDNEAANFYTEDTYNYAAVVEVLSYIISGLSWLVFLLGVFSRKLVGIEMMAVVQISFVYLLSLSEMNPCFKALSNLKFVNGFNYFSLSKGYFTDPETHLAAKGI